MKEKYAQARHLRRHLTLPEWLLWERIKRHEVGAPVFRRQYAYGPYILDFYCIRAKLAIEVDGQHHNQEPQYAKDAARDDWLNAEGIEVYRVPAADVLRDADAVADGILLRAEALLKDK